MATKKAESTEAHVDYSSLNVYQKLQAARLKFLQSGVKKTGKNMHLEFTYFELVDIVPVAESIFSEVGLLAVPSFGAEEGVMYIHDIDHPTGLPPIRFSAPFSQIDPIVSNSGKEVTNKMQALGSSITYMRRYLWQLALDIVEADTIDATLGMDTDDAPSAPKKTKKPATAQDRKKIKEELTSVDTPASEDQVNDLKKALAELISKDPEQESFGQEIAVRTEGFTKITAEACDQILGMISEIFKAYEQEGK